MNHPTLYCRNCGGEIKALIDRFTAPGGDEFLCANIKCVICPFGLRGPRAAEEVEAALGKPVDYWYHNAEIYQTVMGLRR